MRRGADRPRPFKAVIYRHSHTFQRMYGYVYSFPTLEGAIEKARDAILSEYYPVKVAEVWIGYFSGPAKHSPYNGGPRPPDYYSTARDAEPALYIRFKAKEGV